MVLDLGDIKIVLPKMKEYNVGIILQSNKTENAYSKILSTQCARYSQ